MSGGACQKAAQQANDVLAQQAKRDEDCGCGGGCAPAPALGKRDAPRPKKGSNRRGPGCKNADCNACAEQADEVLNAVAGFSDGIPEFSFADVQRARLLAGMQRSLAVPQGSQGGAVPPPSTLDAGYITSCGGCSEDWDAMCAAEYGDAKASTSSGYNSWTASEGECTAKLSCKDYSSLCDCQESEEATRWYCGTHQTSDGAYLYPAGKITCTYNVSTGLCECEAVCPEEGYAWRTGSYEAAACGDGAVETKTGSTVSCSGDLVSLPSREFPLDEHAVDDETAPALSGGPDLTCAQLYAVYNQLERRLLQLNSAFRFCMGTALGSHEITVGLGDLRWETCSSYRIERSAVLDTLLATWSSATALNCLWAAQRVPSSPT